MDNTKFWEEIETLNYDVFNKITGDSEQSTFLQDVTIINKENDKSGIELLDRTLGRYHKFKSCFFDNKLKFGECSSPIIKVFINGITKKPWLVAVLLSVLSYETIEFCKVNFNTNDITLFVQLVKTAIHSTLELIQEFALHI